jgi:hypothetical protein
VLLLNHRARDAAPLLLMSGDVRAELDLARFASAANTPGVR